MTEASRFLVTLYPMPRWPLLENELYRLFSPNDLLLHQCSKGSAD